MLLLRDVLLKSVARPCFNCETYYVRSLSASGLATRPQRRGSYKVDPEKLLLNFPSETTYAEFPKSLNRSIW